jgi:hypothetical protein
MSVPPPPDDDTKLHSDGVEPAAPANRASRLVVGLTAVVLVAAAIATAVLVTGRDTGSERQTEPRHAAEQALANTCSLLERQRGHPTQAQLTRQAPQLRAQETAIAQDRRAGMQEAAQEIHDILQSQRRHHPVAWSRHARWFGFECAARNLSYPNDDLPKVGYGSTVIPAPRPAYLPENDPGPLRVNLATDPSQVADLFVTVWWPFDDEASERDSASLAAVQQASHIKVGKDVTVTRCRRTEQVSSGEYPAMADVYCDVKGTIDGRPGTAQLYLDKIRSGYGITAVGHDGLAPDTHPTIN